MLSDPKREAEIESEIRIAKEPWRKIVLDSVELLRADGHCHGTLSDSAGRRCALGAIYEVTKNDAMLGFNAALELHWRIGKPVAFWNDENSTETVIATLELIARGA